MLYKMEGADGCTVVAETAEDVAAAKAVIDYDRHPCEGTERYLSALYVVNNEFTVRLLLPCDCAPETILRELED